MSSSGLRVFQVSTMANLETGFHELLTSQGAKLNEEICICSSPPKLTGKSDLKMSKSHANVLSFDENESYLSNLYERNEHFLHETTVEKHDKHWYN